MELSAKQASEALYAWLGRNQDLWMVGEYSGEAFRYEDSARSCLQDICSGKPLPDSTPTPVRQLVSMLLMDFFAKLTDHPGYRNEKWSVPDGLTPDQQILAVIEIEIRKSPP